VYKSMIGGQHVGLELIDGRGSEGGSRRGVLVKLRRRGV
jgi:hypothetical protein